MYIPLLLAANERGAYLPLLNLYRPSDESKSGKQMGAYLPLVNLEGVGRVHVRGK